VNNKLIKRLSLDVVMTALILVEFAYRLTGSTLHELIGMSMFTLFIVHGAWNRRWFAALLKGRYAGLRAVSVTINVLLLIAVVLLILSGVLNSDLLFSLVEVEFDLLPRELHTASAYWFLILLGVHLGMHWQTIMAEARKLAGGSWAYLPASLRTAALQVIAATISAYGVFASFARSVFSRLTAYYSFGNVEVDESMLGFFAQYAAIVGLYAVMTYQALQLFKSRSRSPRLSRADALTRNWRRSRGCSAQQR
jgi:hypothetical protein